MSKRDIEEIRARAIVRLKRIDRNGSIIRLLIMWVGIGWIAKMALDSISALAGKTTLANLAIQMAAGFHVKDVAEFCGIILAGGYGLKERNLRRRKLRGDAARIRELEERIDPHRSSSKLTAKGTTRPEDR